jgi:hypothetical protein
MTNHPQQDYFEQVEQGLRDAMRRGAHVRHGGRWRRLERRTPSRHDSDATAGRAHVSRRLSVVLAAACVAAAAIVVFAVGLGAGTQQAFAGWSPTPTMPAKGLRAAAVARCRSKLRSPSRSAPKVGAGRSGETRSERDERRKLSRLLHRIRIEYSRAARWKAVAVDTRGPYTLSLLIHGDRHASCFIGPRASGYAVAVVVGYYNPKVAPAADEINDAGGITGDGSGKDAHTFVEGRAGSGVEGVTLLLADGQRVVATTEKGWYLAWWPGKSPLRAVEVKTASGTHEQGRL